MNQRNEFLKIKSCFLSNCPISLKFTKMIFAPISENSRILYVADLANDVHCNFPPEALMNTVSSYEAAYWLERISYDFLIRASQSTKSTNCEETVYPNEK